MDAPFPMHPSYEEREGVPDRSFPRVSPEQGERMVAAWARLIAGSAALRRAQVFHLHHLTPIHEAAAAVMPGVPIVTHLHGTELKMLDAIARAEPGVGQGPHAALVGRAHGRGGAPRRRDDRDLPPSARRGRAAARARPGHRAPAPRRRRRRALRRPAIATSTSGASAGSTGSCATRRAGTRRAGRRGASATREDEVVDAFFDASTGAPRPVLMFVGRFLGFKRVPLLMRAYARARARMSVPAPLVIWGGAPGEWEGEHPHTVATRAGVERRLLRRLARPRRPAARPRVCRLLRRALRPTSRSASSTSRRWPAGCP